MSSLRKCPRCGYDVGDDDIICDYYGADLGLSSEYCYEIDEAEEASCYLDYGDI